MNGLYGTSKTRQNITVTASGMQGLALTALALIDSGDHVVCIDQSGQIWAKVLKLREVRLTQQPCLHVMGVGI